MEGLSFVVNGDGVVGVFDPFVEVVVLPLLIVLSVTLEIYAESVGFPFGDSLSQLIERQTDGIHGVPDSDEFDWETTTAR